MVPIQDILHRIQWDPACRDRVFDIGYIDRVAGTIVRVPFSEVCFASGGAPALTVRGDDGAVLRIPLHRVRQVWRDGTIFWERQPRGARGEPGGALQSAHGRDTHG